MGKSVLFARSYARILTAEIATRGRRGNQDGEKRRFDHKERKEHKGRRSFKGRVETPPLQIPSALSVPPR
jgi:hypothetical protein